MKETILLFNAPAREELLKIETALFPLHIRLRKIKKEDYCQPLGVLAGIKEIPPAESKYEGPELPGTMFVFCFLSDSRLNKVLAALRRCGAGPFPYNRRIPLAEQVFEPESWQDYEFIDKTRSYVLPSEGEYYDLIRHFKASHNVLGYMMFRIWADEPGPATLAVGVSDGCIGWLNGEKVLEIEPITSGEFMEPFFLGFQPFQRLGHVGQLCFMEPHGIVDAFQFVAVKQVLVCFLPLGFSACDLAEHAGHFLGHFRAELLGKPLSGSFFCREGGWVSGGISFGLRGGRGIGLLVFFLGGSAKKLHADECLNSMQS